MKLSLLFSLVVLMSNSLFAKKATVFLVRHAEVSYENGDWNPSLTRKGERRALALAQVLNQENITKIYATTYKRTQETAQPTANKKNLELSLVNSSRQIAEEILSFQHEKTLVAGHSNTLPEILYFLGATKTQLPEFSHSVFNKLYKVTIETKEDEKKLMITLKEESYEP